MVTDSGTRFWDAFTDVPFEKIDVSPETRALIQRAVFFEPQPFVRRVVFIATPHRGSFRVSSFVLGTLSELRHPAPHRSWAAPTELRKARACRWKRCRRPWTACAPGTASS